MQISDKHGENEMLVKHIRQTSSIASSIGMNDVARLQKLAKVVKVANQLHIKVMSSGKIKGQVIEINALGMIGSLRQKNDGFTFFGCKRHDIKKTSAQN